MLWPPSSYMSCDSGNQRIIPSVLSFTFDHENRRHSAENVQIVGNCMISRLAERRNEQRVGSRSMTLKPCETRELEQDIRWLLADTCPKLAGKFSVSGEEIGKIFKVRAATVTPITTQSLVGAQTATVPAKIDYGQ